MSLGKWRGSASVIMAARNKLAHSNVRKSPDYGILMIERPHTGSFASSSVFPGGVHELADESPLWLDLFRKFGVPNEKLSELTIEGKSRPQLFQKASENSMHREISLRITALRETFEEVGVLIVRKQDSFKSETACATVHTDFDSAHWQKKVHGDATEFLKLFHELQVLPDLWSLHEWSTWMTPSIFKKKFQTVFYVLGLDEIPQLHVDTKEVAQSNWCTPQEFLAKSKQLDILLPPPQFCELARLTNFSTQKELLSFAKDRAMHHGMTLLLPVQYECIDGIVAVLPGDDMYPNNPFDTEGFIRIDKSIEDFRANSNHLNRFETSNDMRIVSNIMPSDGQITPKLNLLENKM